MSQTDPLIALDENQRALLAEIQRKENWGLAANLVAAAFAVAIGFAGVLNLSATDFLGDWKTGVFVAATAFVMTAFLLFFQSYISAHAKSVEVMNRIAAATARSDALQSRLAADQKTRSSGATGSNFDL